MTSKVEELQQLLNIEDSDVAYSILIENDWDIQLAVESYFDRQKGQQEQQEQLTENIQPSRHLAPSSSVANVGLGLSRSPASLLWNIWRGLVWLAVRLLRLPIWLYAFIFNRSPPLLSDTPPPSHIAPQDANSLLISSIHEAVNSVEPSSTTTALDGRHSHIQSSTQSHSIPSLYVGTHSEAIRDAKDLAQFGIIALVDGGDTSTKFKYRTLANNRFTKIVNDNDCLVWIGDVTANRDAYNFAKSRSVGVFPHVELHSLQALPTFRNALVSTPTMSHLGSVSGSEALGDAFIDTLSSRYLNRIGPYLSRLRREKYERQRATYLREAAEKSENERMQRDAEKVLKRRQEMAMSSRLAEEAAREKEQNELKKLDKEVQLKDYRSWLKRTVPAEPTDGVKLAFKLADGRRIVRAFSLDTSLDILYTYIDTIDIEPSSNAQKPILGEEYIPEFNLYTSYPREHIPNQNDKTVADVNELSKGGFVAVESTITHDSSDEEDEEDDEDA